MLAAGTYPNALDRVYYHLVNFTRKLRGKTPKPVIDAEDCEGDDPRDLSGIFSQAGTLKEAFILHRRSRSQRTSTLGGPAGSNGPWGPPDEKGVEGDNKVPTGIV